MPNIPLEDPERLRKLAAWYRDYAARAHAPWVSEGRRQTAEELERHVARLEGRRKVTANANRGGGR